MRISRQRRVWQMKMLPLYKVFKGYVGGKTKPSAIFGCKRFITDIFWDSKRMKTEGWIFISLLHNRGWYV